MTFFRLASSSFCLSVLLLLPQLVPVQPGQGGIQFLPCFRYITLRELGLDLILVEGRFQVEDVGFKAVLGRNSLLLCFILILELFSIVHHLVNLLLGESALVIGDCDLLLLSASLLHSRDIQDAISIYVKGDFNLRSSSWGRGDSS